MHIALHLRHELGPDALSFVGGLAEEARLTSTPDAARLWNDVASELSAIDQHDGAGERMAPPASVWGLMQRIEYYRHRAAEVERKATDAPATFRDAMLELAEEWRDLALLADLHARVNREKAKLRTY